MKFETVTEKQELIEKINKLQKFFIPRVINNASGNSADLVRLSDVHLLILGLPLDLEQRVNYGLPRENTETVYFDSMEDAFEGKNYHFKS